MVQKMQEKTLLWDKNNSGVNQTNIQYGGYMNTLVAYATKYGCTQKCAQELSKRLKDNVELVNLKEKSNVDLSKYDRVIIGGSIYIGKVQKEVTDFCSSNLDELLKKEIGLFICGMDMNMLEKQTNEIFPEELLKIAKTVKHFGGEFTFKKMNFMEKFIIKKITKVTSDKSNINYDNINKFAMDING